MIGQCCRSFLASFKIWNMATVGGNLCMALPAGPMISLCAALDGVCVIWTPDGGERRISIFDFVLGAAAQRACSPANCCAAIELPRAALTRRTAFRRASLTPLGRSGVLLIGALAADGAFLLTVTASTRRPVRLAFAGVPTPAGPRRAARRRNPGQPLLRRRPRPAGLAPPHDVRIRRGNPRRTRRGPSVSFLVNGKTPRGDAASRPVPANLLARARLVRRQERLRCRRLRRLHRPSRRQARA